MKQTTKRNELIQAGREIIVRQGFNAAGLSSILTTADVPKGSFYYYFKNKEEFGLAIIEDFAAEYQLKLQKTVNNHQLSPLQRLNSYFAAGQAEMEACKCVNGCLIGNLAQELAAQSNVFRDRLDQIFSEWEAQIAQCLEAGQNAGEISTDINPTKLAQVILAGWQGAILRSKVAQSTAPMQIFVETLFHHILGKSTAS
ncbi:transcriptional regulator, TetR family protein [Synechococcus sp. PCC 7335]|uniref:TetR/AcrR family transcriptional regulator n=1 Tax=Synechococcus sp. (strain ATCC 29403 / PCC 7335) TaxID=91464 RepID=UPI00017EC384|nr:TetR/AcrR family transcriptional regulator [Synechococcus sp. PCC 7335]EDX84797.1 transcriptional regulator, TetR family protein [Synechococcus sp. PCC 7335]